MLTPTFAALIGSVATAIAIFGGGLAVEAYKRRRDRAGMALAIAGAIEALIGLIEARDMVAELLGASARLAAGEPVDFVSLVTDNEPYLAITAAFAGQIGGLGGDLPFRVARFLTYAHGLQNDVKRLEASRDRPAHQARLIETMAPLWPVTHALGTDLVRDLRRSAGVPGAGEGPVRGRGRRAERRMRGGEGQGRCPWTVSGPGPGREPGDGVPDIDGSPPSAW